MRFLLIVATTIVLFNCNNPPQNKITLQVEQNEITPQIEQNRFIPPADWKLINACSAEFYVPNDVYEEKVQAIDSCVKKYRNANILLTLDVAIGDYIDHISDSSRKNDFSGQKNFSLKKLQLTDSVQKLLITKWMLTKKHQT